MPLSHCRYAAIQKCRSGKCRWNIFTELTLICGTWDASLDIRIRFHAVQYFSTAPECRFPATKLQIWSSGWTISSWTASAHPQWYHKALSPTDSRCGPNQRYSTWWLQSHHRIDGPEIAHTCWRSCLPLHTPLLWQQSSYEQDFWEMCFLDWLPLSRLLETVIAHDVGITYRKAWVWQVSSDGFCAPVARLPSPDQPLTILLPLVGLYWGTSEFAYIVM